jgi:DNA-binding response OmpR family regulator
VLVVDADSSYRDALSSGLKDEGYAVATALDGRTALRAFAEFEPDVLLLEQRLPDTPGTEICRQVRLISDIPILMLSAVADEVEVVLSFELGADDYLFKPLRMRELAARIDARLRSRQRSSEANGTAPREDLTIGPLHISFDSHTVELAAKRITLSPKEFYLLAELARRPGSVFSREELMDAVWGVQTADHRTLDTHMYRLRSKIEHDPARPELILTVRGVGFLLNDKYQSIEQKISQNDR